MANAGTATIQVNADGFTASLARNLRDAANRDELKAVIVAAGDAPAEIADAVVAYLAHPTSDPAPTTYSELADVIENLPLLVREARRSRGLSIRQAATQAGINFSTLTRVEHGEDMRAGSLQIILRWLDATAHDEDAGGDHHA